MVFFLKNHVCAISYAFSNYDHRETPTCENADTPDQEFLAFQQWDMEYGNSRYEVRDYDIPIGDVSSSNHKRLKPLTNCLQAFLLN